MADAVDSKVRAPMTEVNAMAGRPKTKPIKNSYIQSLMVLKNCKNLQELASKIQIPYTTLATYADSEVGANKHLAAAKKAADGLGISTDDFIKGLLGIEDAKAT